MAWMSCKWNAFRYVTGRDASLHEQEKFSPVMDAQYVACIPYKYNEGRIAVGRNAAIFMVHIANQDHSAEIFENHFRCGTD